jgi:hypothetical protein
MVNTFRIVIFSRKNEVFIARFVGANTKFIAGPFLVEGCLLGIASSVIAIIVFTFVLQQIDILPAGEIFIHLWNSVFSFEILISGLVGWKLVYMTSRELQDIFEESGYKWQGVFYDEPTRFHAMGVGMVPLT